MTTPPRFPNLRVVFRPCWSGDFRLEPDPAAPDPVAGKSVLTVVKPTASDKAKLAPFLKHAETEGWTSNTYGARGETEAETIENALKAVRAGTVHLNAPMSVAGPALMRITTVPSETWTAVRSVGGVVTVHDGSTLPPDVDPEAVATVNKPNRGCPEPEAASRRASQVLRTFCTADQWNQFQREGRFRAVGNVTGRAYMVYHNDEAAQRGLSRALMVLDGTPGGREVCVWDATVPAEEQALALKLAVEHREAWLLELGTARHAEGLDGLSVGDGVNLVPTVRGRLQEWT